MYRLEIEEKLPYDQAWGLVREQWAFLPSEEDQPSLPFDPATLSSQLRLRLVVARPGHEPVRQRAMVFRAQ